MPPSAARKDELLEDVRSRLLRVEQVLGEMQRTMARIEQAEEQAHSAASAAIVRMDALDVRLTALEAARNRAEGAAAGASWLWKALIAVGLIGGGAAARHLAGK